MRVGYRSVGWAYDRGGWVGRAEQRAGRVPGTPASHRAPLASDGDTYEECGAAPTRRGRRKSSGRGTWRLEPPSPTSGSEATRRHSHARPLASVLLHLPPPPGISLLPSRLLTSSRARSYLPLPIPSPLLPSFSLPHFFLISIHSPLPSSPSRFLLNLPSHPHPSLISPSSRFSPSSSPHPPFHPLPPGCSLLTPPRPIRNTECTCFGH